jgi:ADP-ribose pyrophosphatase YjhB (NUDIX family)
MTEMKNTLAKTGNGKDCAFAVIIRGKKILLGQRNYTPDKWKAVSVWTCAGGRSEIGETLEMTLRREVKEETGIDDLEIIRFLGTVPGAKEGDVTSFFVCQSRKEPALMEPDKFSEWRWFELEDYLRGELGTFNPQARKLIVEYVETLV